MSIERPVVRIHGLYMTPLSWDNRSAPGVEELSGPVHLTVGRSGGEEVADHSLEHARGSATVEA